MNWVELQKRCYTPYSCNCDMCMVVGRSGLFYPGVRIENISFSLSVEAIQTALFSCLSEGDEPVKLVIPNAEVNESDNGNRKKPKRISEWSEYYPMEVNAVADPEKVNGARIFQTEEKKVSFSRLQALIRRCVIPYSTFPVSALLETDIGIFSGANMELADWQKGLCAERVAMSKALSCGAKEFSRIHIYAPKSDFVSPCGACRQVMAEHMLNGEVVLYHNEHEITRLPVSALLPYQFVASSLYKQHK